MPKYMDKIKDNLPEAKHFARKYFREILTILTLAVAFFSSWKGFFINGLGMSLFFAFLGLLAGVIFPRYTHLVLHKFYHIMAKKNMAAEIGLECVKIVLAFIFAFVYFGIVGLLASSAYRYFSAEARGEKGHDRAA